MRNIYLKTKYCSLKSEWDSIRFSKICKHRLFSNEPPNVASTNQIPRCVLCMRISLVHNASTIWFLYILDVNHSKTQNERKIVSAWMTEAKRKTEQHAESRGYVSRVESLVKATCLKREKKQRVYSKDKNYICMYFLFLERLIISNFVK